MENLSAIVGAMAAVFSAVAAFLALRVANRAFRFQKSSIMKKAEIETISELIEKLFILKTIRQLNPLELPDDRFLSIENLLLDIENLAKSLCSQNDRFNNKMEISTSTKKDSIFSLFSDSNPWGAVQQQKEDVIVKEIEFLKSIRDEIL